MSEKEMIVKELREMVAYHDLAKSKAEKLLNKLTKETPRKRNDDLFRKLLAERDAFINKRACD